MLTPFVTKVWFLTQILRKLDFFRMSLKPTLTVLLRNQDSGTRSGAAESGSRFSIWPSDNLARLQKWRFWADIKCSPRSWNFLVQRGTEFAPVVTVILNLYCQKGRWAVTIHLGPWDINFIFGIRSLQEWYHSQRLDPGPFTAVACHCSTITISHIDQIVGGV